MVVWLYLQDVVLLPVKIPTDDELSLGQDYVKERNTI